MKIIIIPNEPNPNMTGRHYGIAKALIAAGHEVHTVMWDLPHQMSKGRLFKHILTSLNRRDYEYEDINMHHFGRLPLFWPYLNGWLFGRQLKQLYTRTGADIIFAQSFTNETRVPSSLPYIYDLADDYYAPAVVFGSLLHKIMFAVLGVKRSMRIMTQNAVAVTAVSDILARYARQYSANVTTLPNGVETAIIRALPRQPVIAPRSLIYVTGFGPWSQPIKLMKSVMKLRTTFPDISLTLVGEGSEVPAMQAFIARHDAEDFIAYAGFIHDRRQVFELIQRHEIGLNISEKNSWRDAAHPMKVIEYSALGIKVVSTDLEGVKALNLPNVFMFSNTTSPKLTKTLRRALTDPVLLYPQVAAQTLQDYSWEHIISRLEDVIQTVLHRSDQLSIVHVTPSYSPTLGGLEKVVHTLANTQVKAGNRVTVITAQPTHTQLPEMESARIVRLRNIVFANTTIMPMLFPELMKISKIRVVHLHVTQAFTPEMVWLVSLLKKYKYVAHIHLDVPPTGTFGALLDIYKRIFLRAVLRHAKVVIVPTEDYRTLIQNKYGIPGNKVQVVPNATDHEIIATPKNFPQKSPFRLLFVGRLSEQKNIPLLIDSLDYYQTHYRDKVSLRIIGAGKLKASLEQRVAAYGLDSAISFDGVLAGLSLEQTYLNSDIFVLSSIAESFGLVLVEAMTKGLPLVSTDIPAVRNVVTDKVNALLVDGTPQNFAEAIHRIVTDCKLYETMSANNIQRAHTFSWTMVQDKIMAIYKAIA